MLRFSPGGSLSRSCALDLQIEHVVLNRMVYVSQMWTKLQMEQHNSRATLGCSLHIVLVCMDASYGFVSRRRLIDEIGITWREILRKVWGLPYKTHFHLLPLISYCLPVFDGICNRSLNIVKSCLFQWFVFRSFQLLRWSQCTVTCTGMWLVAK
jgi:hypothetical protein